MFNTNSILLCGLLIMALSGGAHSDWINPEFVARFDSRGDGTVRDSQTGLLWTLADNGAGVPVGAAQAYCDTLDLAGLQWQLPTRSQLSSLYDRSQRTRTRCGRRTCNTVPDLQLSGYYFWSGDRNSDGLPWIVHLTDGLGAVDPIGLEEGRVLCVAR